MAALLAALHGIPNHICMLDGPDYPTPQATSSYGELLKENERLKVLLLENGLSWVPERPKEPVKAHHMNTRRSSAVSSRHVADDLPHIPTEIQLRILRYAMKCSFPIIDPFHKIRKEHLSKEERIQRRQLPLQILLTCKAYHEEGFKHFFDNEFMFTQATALQNFSRVSAEFRSTIKHVTLRVVGKYYDDEPQTRSILGPEYHPSIPNFKIPLYGRPKGAQMDKGIHAYCWQQFADFMINFQVPSSSRRMTKLFPSLTRMRVDLINFSDHLHYPGPHFATVLRWHAGPFLEELIVTGVPEDDPEEGPEQMFTRIVKDEGVFASGPPVAVSRTKSLKTLPYLGLAIKVVRADKFSIRSRKLQNLDRSTKRRCATGPVDPKGSQPPNSLYATGKTVWKFTQDSLSKPERKWIEFDRESGLPADDIDMWSDIGDSVTYDSDGNPVDSDGNLIDSDEDMNYDDDDDEDMPPLMDA